MSGFSSISSYHQMNQTYEMKNMGTDGAVAKSRQDQAYSSKESSKSKVEVKKWSPIDAASSLVPRKTEYGYTIGDVQLSEKAADYLDKLKSKFHNMEFITVSSDMKDQVKKNAAAYGNSSKMVVLIDDEKLERMATDESYRKKYEGIIASAQGKLSAAKNSLASTGANIKNFGMSVDANGKESFFATVSKSQELEKKRIEKKAAEKKEIKAKEKKKAEKKAEAERIEKAREKKAEEAERREEKAGSKMNEEEYVNFEAQSLEDLVSRVRSYSYDSARERVMTESEKNIGRRVDYRG